MTETAYFRFFASKSFKIQRAVAHIIPQQFNLAYHDMPPKRKRVEDNEAERLDKKSKIFETPLSGSESVSSAIRFIYLILLIISLCGYATFSFGKSPLIRLLEYLK
jgi:hypothetical protein